MVERGYTRDTEQCRVKVKDLRQVYYKTKEDFVDEEEEEEENAQQANGESVLLGSQDLFITLEPVPPQGRFPDPDGREGTSGTNVSMLPELTLSLRLSQIRRRKKHTCDDMFSKLLQSSCTDRAQLNAWRHSVTEARKAFSEHDQNTQEEMLRLMGEQTDMIRHLVELQERQQEHRLPLHPLYNHLPSSPSSIFSSPRCPRTWRGGSRHPATPLQRMAQVTKPSFKQL
nr:uncharacterized protein LOC125631920 [Caretta caretta]XP_048695354.1 uncharacterized protein LOC125631920 [Caretta caretta]